MGKGDGRGAFAMPRHDPSRKRKRMRFRRPPKPQRATPSSPSPEAPSKATYNYSESKQDACLEVKPVVKPAQIGPAILGAMEQLAPLVWETDYDVLFQLEEQALEQRHGLMT